MTVDAPPNTTLDRRFSAPDATPTEWRTGREALGTAELYWLSTVRADGRPHVTPLMAVWWDGALYFCTGESEQKVRNLATNLRCVITTGCNHLDEGLDLVVEGTAERVSDLSELEALATEFASKYGPDWEFDVRDGEFLVGDGGPALVHRLAPVTAFGFAKGDYGQTRWRF